LVPGPRIYLINRIMKPEADISVVCPTYNAAAFVLATLRTVTNQESLPAELIVSDDGSTDGTPEIVESFFATCNGLSTRLVRNSHVGPGAARNAGLKVAKGDWVAFLDADDLWFPGKLKAVVAASRAHPECNFFCHSEQHILLDGSTKILDYGASYNESEPLGSQLFHNNLFSTSAVVCRRQLLQELGSFDELLMSGQDYELWLRLAPRLQVHFIRRIYGSYMDRPGNITSGKLEQRTKNIISIKHRHRDKATLLLYCLTMGKLGASYLKAKLKQCLPL